METDLNKLRDRAYSIAKEHGFHEKEQSDETYLMLIITEIAEAVNADRKGHHADMPSFNRIITQDSPNLNDQEYYAICYKRDFETWIKDSVEDEIADVAIRLLDFAGAKKIYLDDIFSYDIQYGRAFSENCYSFVKNLVDDMRHENLCTTICRALRDIENIASCCHVDLFKFIDLKMKYNELRPYKNGKQY